MDPRNRQHLCNEAVTETARSRFLSQEMSIIDQYQTYRRVNVEGSVGRLYYVSLLLMLVVIIFYMMIHEKSHLFFENNIQGSVWARLQDPKQAKLDCTSDIANKTCEKWDWLEAVESGVLMYHCEPKREVIMKHHAIFFSRTLGYLYCHICSRETATPSLLSVGCGV